MSIEVDEIKDKSRQFWELKSQRAALKQQLDAIGEHLQQAQNELVTLLQDAELDKWVDDFGSVSLKVIESVRVPQTMDDRKKLFDYLANEHGVESAWSFFNINSTSLQKLHKDAKTQAGEHGENFAGLPGLEPAREYVKVSATKKRN